MSAVADAAATGMPLFMPAPDPSHTATGKAAFSKATMRHSVLLEEHSRLNLNTHQQQHQSSHQSFSATPVGRPLIHKHSLALSCCIVLPNMLINLCPFFHYSHTKSPPCSPPVDVTRCTIRRVCPLMAIITSTRSRTSCNPSNTVPRPCRGTRVISSKGISN